jgi:prepilin peptidase CpaA
MLMLIEAMLLAALAVMLCIAALGDIRSYRIPNTLNLAVAVTAIPYWIVKIAYGHVEVSAWLWPQVALIAAVFVIMITLMFLNILGGGDAKLLLALAFWLPPAHYLNMIVFMSIAGGLICVVLLLKQRTNGSMPITTMNGDTTQSKTKQRVPYGVAIAAGGLIPVSQLILNALLA